MGVVYKSNLVTSPNMDHAPEMQWGKAEVRLRKDARFGADDFTLWPQWHRDEVPYLACVPRKWFPGAPEQSKRFASLWWTPTRDDIKLPGSVLSSETGFVAGVEMDAMTKLKGPLVEEAETLVLKMKEGLAMGAVIPTLLPSLGSCISFLRHAWLALTDTAGSFEEKRMEVAEFQRACLEVMGMVNYFNWKTMRWDSGLEAIPKEPEWVIGCYVEDVNSAGMLWRMGVPVWLVRDKIAVLRSRIHIDSPTLSFLKPNDFEEEGVTLEVDEAFPVVYCSTPKTIAHYLAIQRFSRIRSVMWQRTTKGSVLTDAARLHATIQNAVTMRVSLADLRAQRAAGVGVVQTGPCSASTSSTASAVVAFGQGERSTYEFMIFSEFGKAAAKMSSAGKRPAKQAPCE